MTTADAGRAQRSAGISASGGSQQVLSHQNARLVQARKLTKPAGRTAARMFLAEGAPAVREAARVGAIAGLFVTASAAARHPDVLEMVRDSGASVDIIEERSAAALSETVTPQGLVAMCPFLDVDLATALMKRPQLAIAIVEGNDPGNAGTVLRTADAAGAQTMILAGPGVDPYNGKSVRATAGSLFHLDVVRASDPMQMVGAARSAGLQVLATSGYGEVDLDGLIDVGALSRPTLWLMGNEAHGLPAEVLQAAHTTVRIPIYGAAESLNLAMAAAVCLYASARAQRPSG
jgi:TrmH family RNA methyltransferase